MMPQRRSSQSDTAPRASMLAIQFLLSPLPTAKAYLQFESYAIDMIPGRDLFLVLLIFMYFFKTYLGQW